MLVRQREILKANKFGLFPLGHGESARFIIDRRVTPSDLFLRKLTLMAILKVDGWNRKTYKSKTNFNFMDSR